MSIRNWKRAQQLFFMEICLQLKTFVTILACIYLFILSHSLIFLPIIVRSQALARGRENFQLKKFLEVFTSLL